MTNVKAKKRSSRKRASRKKKRKKLRNRDTLTMTVGVLPGERKPKNNPLVCSFPSGICYKFTYLLVIIFQLQEYGECET